jgi:hypothetical protein
MKSTLTNYIIAIFLAIIAVETIRLGFHLMNQSDSLMFYIGLMLIGLVMFLSGWYLATSLLKIFSKDDEKSEENHGNKE